ncbi:MAG: diguanylate cyclase, partial [Deltaproteobacteria bacterium]|nr:diguanylate cyclase [Deltaproteobacteria bacterium]
RLIRHYGLHSDDYDVAKQGWKYTLKSGRVLEFIPTSFLHAPGAIATYDARTRTLFSGDLFGAIGREWSLFADEEFIAPMEEFHRLYMPSKKILRSCMNRLEGYAIDRILPQHGSILEGEQVKTATARLRELECGIDLSVEEP